MWGVLRRVLTAALRWLSTGALRRALSDYYDEPVRAAQEAIDLVPWEEMTGPLIEAVADVLAPVFDAAAGVVLRESRTATRDVPFQPTDALGWARRYAADRVVEITQQTRTVIRDRIVQGLSEGRSVDDVAAEVRQVVGLHSKWADAVARRARNLNGNPDLSPAQRRTAIDAYRDRLLDARARNIAHTELLTASNAGRLAGYEADAASGGLTMAAVEKVWLTAHDERICPICLPMNGVEVDGLEGSFVLPNGKTVLHPPAHPSCRCAFIVRPRAGAVAVAKHGNPDDPGYHLLHPDTARFELQGPSPLDYSSSTWRTPDRAVLRLDQDPGAPEKHEPFYGDHYAMRHTGPTGRRLKKPRRIDTPPASPGTVAFVDYSIDGDTLIVHYMRTRNDSRGQGHATRLLLDLLDAHPDQRWVDWGKIMQENMDRVRQRVEAARPDRRYRHKKDW